MIRRCIVLLCVLGAMLWLTLSGSWAQDANAPFHISTCSAVATCCFVPVPLMTEPVPGGTPTTVAQSAVVLYGAHVSNQNASNEFMQFFNATAQPAAATTPLGASSWITVAGQDRDLSIGELRGMSFTAGIEVCCSSTQGTFTPVGNCGFLLEFY